MKKLKKRKVHIVPPYFHAPQHAITIALVGCGGTGSRMLVNLARIHTALLQLGHPGLHVTAFDFDIVTEYNPGRQMFYKADIGFNKAVVLVSRLNASYGIQWDAFPKAFDTPFMSNILISCIDTITGRKQLDVLSKKEGVTYKRKKLAQMGVYQHDDNLDLEPYEKKYYWMDIGNTRASGQVILSTVGRHHQQTDSKLYIPVTHLPTVIEKFPELKTMKDKDQGPSCSLAEALENQSLFINSILAEYGSKLLFDLFRKQFITQHGMFVNIESCNTQPIKVT